jgi:hypothetical protein
MQVVSVHFFFTVDRELVVGNLNDMGTGLVLAGLQHQLRGEGVDVFLDLEVPKSE